MRRGAISVVAAGVFAIGGPTARAAEVTIPAAEVRDQEGGPPRLFLVTVGVNGFNDPFWPRLKWAERDAERVSASLGVDTGSERVVTLLTGAAVTREAVDQALTAVARRARRIDSVVVYISTHGTLALADRGFVEPVLVLPATRSQDPARGGIPEATLRRWLERIPAARKLLILAACHSGLGKSRLTPRVQELLSGTKGRVAPLAAVSEGALVLAAAARGETAREDDKLKGDVYTHFFLEALSAFDRNRDGAVSALEAHDYAKDRAYAFTGGRQRATLEAQAVGDADLPLRGRVRRDGLPILEARDEDLAGLSVSVDGGEKGRLPTAVALSLGTSRVRLYRGAAERPFAVYDVAAPAGARVGLDDLLTGPPWSLGLGYGTIRLIDPGARRVAGSTMRRVEIALGYRPAAELGFGLALGRFTGDTVEVRHGVKAQVAWESWELSVEYVRPSWRGVDVGAGLAAGRTSALLRLRDETQTLEFDALATTLVPFVFAGWTDPTGVALRLLARYATDRFDFGAPGAVDARRSETLLQLQYRFGGIARRR